MIRYKLFIVMVVMTLFGMGCTDSEDTGTGIEARCWTATQHGIPAEAFAEGDEIMFCCFLTNSTTHSIDWNTENTHDLVRFTITGVESDFSGDTGPDVYLPIPNSGTIPSGGTLEFTKMWIAQCHRPALPPGIYRVTADALMHFNGTDHPDQDDHFFTVE